MTSLGPVPLPVVLAVVALALALLLARCWPQRAPGAWRPVVAVLLDMFLVGLLAARAVFVLRHLPEYSADPWAVLRIGDGGFNGTAFFLAAATWAAWKLRGVPETRRLVLYCALSGTCAWGFASLLLQQWQAQHVHAPTLVLRDLQGEPVTLHPGDGRPLVVNLWASWCGPCVREMPLLASAQQQHAQVRFVFVNQGEDAATVSRFLRQNVPGLRGVLVDEATATSQALGVQVYPGTLFFDGGGRLRELHVGELSAAGLEHKLSRLR